MSTKRMSTVEVARNAARRRWGEQRVVQLHELTDAQRRLVLALVAAAKAENERPEGTA